jgi:hypothetical protein
MKKTILTCLLVSVSGFAFTQLAGEAAKQVYSAPNLAAAIATHKTIAILPFKATISYKRVPKNFDAALNAAEEQKMGENLQEGMYTYLLRKGSDYTVSFQEPARTNALLKQNNVYEKLDILPADSLAKILGVDAVIKASYAYEKTSSEGGAIAKSVIFGGMSSVASGDLTMQIYNGKDGALLWRFYKQMNEKLTSSANEMMVRMMKKVGRNFPYEKS